MTQSLKNTEQINDIIIKILANFRKLPLEDKEQLVKTLTVIFLEDTRNP